jgi:regulator of sirC expression with transglutaminase-like and TPR domain
VSSCSTSASSLGALPSGPAAHTAGSERILRLEALRRLIGDESAFVWERVRPEIAREGRVARPMLRREARSADARVRIRARMLLEELERRTIVRRLVGYAAREKVDLEPALFLLGRYLQPSLDPRPWQRKLDAIAAELVDRGRRTKDELERVRLLPRYLGTELGFGGSKGEFHNPDNIHLQRVIDRRAGMPLSLCAIYLFVARRIGIRGGILPLPGHVMLRLWAGPTGLIFDPYHKGQERTERECRRYVEQNRRQFDASMLREAPERALFKRQLLNLSRSAEKRGMRREIADLALVIHALESRTPQGAVRVTGSKRGSRS